MNFKAERLDHYLVREGYFKSRTMAKQKILEGQVVCNGQTILRPSYGLGIADKVTIQDHNSEIFVSRGGLKLQKAIEEFSLQISGKFALDIGASTGGFTDCLLQHGAQRVLALDVGHGQLDTSLKNDKRVINREKTNFRYFDPGELGSLWKTPEIITADLSFISLRVVIKKMWDLLAKNGDLVVLFKPQFEAGKDLLGQAKKGILKDEQVHQQLLDDFVKFCCEQKIMVDKIAKSPILGKKGNVEFLIHISKK